MEVRFDAVAPQLECSLMGWCFFNTQTNVCFDTHDHIDEEKSSRFDSLTIILEDDVLTSMSALNLDHLETA